MIGDPSFRSADRALLTREAVVHNVAGIRRQLERFLEGRTTPGTNVWLKDVVVTQDHSPMGAGYMSLDKGEMQWTLTYDEIDIVLEGELVITRGSEQVRGKAGVEELKGGREQIVITQIPYGVNRATLVERIAQLVNEKVLTDISYVGDQSDENTRVVIELKRDANPKVIIANLYKHTALESSFAATMLAIDHGRPKLLPLKDANAVYIDHRREVVLRRTRYELRKAEERAKRAMHDLRSGHGSGTKAS